jgi:mannose-6-phosphate isomerase-like protein (cupin superfamily)
MSSLKDTSVRGTAVYDFKPASVLRGQNFFVQWLEGESSTFEASSKNEMLLLLPEGGAEVATQAGKQALPGRSVCVLPAGAVTVRLHDRSRAALIASSRPDLAPDAPENESDYASPDPRIVGSEGGYRRTRSAGNIHVISIDDIKPPADKPRLKMLQTDTLSINWVEYEGARDRSALSPHSHTNFEQGSLAVAGHFVHHLRAPWGADANQWREDEHLEAGPASMITIPVNLIHTTEGVGDGPHLLIDVFSPPRQDFIDKGWVANASDYTRD